MTVRPTSDDAARALQALIAAAFPNGSIPTSSPSSNYGDMAGGEASQQAALSRFISAIPQQSTSTISLPRPVPQIDPALISTAYHDDYTTFEQEVNSLQLPRASTSIYTPIATRSGRQARRSGSAERAKDREAVMFNDYFDFPSEDEEDDLDFQPRSDDPDPDFDFNWAGGEAPLLNGLSIEEDNGYDTLGAPSVDEDEEEEEEEDEMDDLDEMDELVDDDDEEDEDSAFATPSLAYNSKFSIPVFDPLDDIPIASTSALPQLAQKSKPKAKKLPRSPRAITVAYIPASPTASVSSSATTSRKRARSSSDPSSVVDTTLTHKKLPPVSPKKVAGAKKPTKASLAKQAKAAARLAALSQVVDTPVGALPSGLGKRQKYTKEESDERRRGRNKIRMAGIRADAKAVTERDATRLVLLEKENIELRERVKEYERREEEQRLALMGGGSDRNVREKVSRMVDIIPQIDAMAPEHIMALRKLLEKAARSQSES